MIPTVDPQHATPSYGTPPYAPPADPTTQYGAPPVGGYPQGPPPGAFPPPAPADWSTPAAGDPASPTAPKKNRTALIIGLIVVFALIIGGVAAAIVMMSDSGPDVELSIDTCEIAADGTMTATGSVENLTGDASDVDVEVAFRDVAGSSVVGNDSVEVQVPGNSAERWSAEGVAGDEVQQITCDVTIDD